MESHKLNQLSEKYWQGACTEQEEEQLRRVFQFGKVPEEHRVLAAYLLAVDEEGKYEPLDEAFEEEMLHVLQRQQTRRTQWNYFTSIAASIVLILGLTFVLRSSFSSSLPEEVSTFVDTYDDSELAYQEVKKALMMMSSEMNRGIEHTEMLGKLHEAKSEIETHKKQ